MPFQRITAALAAIFMLALVGGGFSAMAQTAPQTDTQLPAADDKVAVVNGHVIPRGELDNEMNQFKNRMAQQRRQVPPAMLADIQKRILEDLIDAELLYQHSREKGIEIGAEIIESQLTQVKQGFNDAAAFAKALEEVNLTEAKFRLMIQRRVAIQTMIAKQVTPRVAVADGEIQAYYDQNLKKYTTPEEVRASHILIQLAQDADEAQKEEALRKIGAVQEKLKQGQEFSEVAKTDSEGPSNVQGGDLGFFTRGKMVKPFEDAVFALAEGQVSGVVQTQFGYHLIKVTGSKVAKTSSLEEVRPEITQALKLDKTRQLVTELIKTLRNSAAIETFL